MNQYIGANFLRQQLPPLLRAVYPKLLRFIPFRDPATKDLFFRIRDMVMLEATQHVAGDPTLTAMTQGFVVAYTTQMLKSIDRSVSVLFIGSSSRSKVTLTFDISKFVSIRDLRDAVASKLSNISPSQIILTTIKEGRLLRVHSDNSHIFNIHIDQNESIVAYEIPALSRKQESSPYLFQVIQTKPSDKHFVPFFLYATGEKQLNSKWLYENVAGAYIFSSSKPSEQAMTLKLVPAGGEAQELSMGSTKALPPLSTLTASALHSLHATAIVEVEWGNDATFEELQGYNKEQYHTTQSVISWTLDEFRVFGIGGPSTLANFLCNVSSGPSENFTIVQRFVSAVYDVVRYAVDRVSLRLAAQVFGGLSRVGNEGTSLFPSSVRVIVSDCVCSDEKSNSRSFAPRFNGKIHCFDGIDRSGAASRRSRRSLRAEQFFRPTTLFTCNRLG